MTPNTRKGEVPQPRPARLPLGAAARHFPLLARAFPAEVSIASHPSSFSHYVSLNMVDVPIESNIGAGNNVAEPDPYNHIQRLAA